jgi:two-component system, response regulator YesN
MYNLLIVEDETIECVALKEIIEDNFKNILVVHTAETGDEALSVAESVRPEIILMDIHLGSDNGIDISEQILEDLSLARIVILTAYDNFEYAQKAIKLGLKDYLLKPVDTAELLSVIKKQVSIIKQAQSELESLGLASSFSDNLKPFWEKQFISMLNANNFDQDHIEMIFEVLKIKYSYAFIIKLEAKFSGEVKFLQKLNINNRIIEILRKEKGLKNAIVDLDGMNDISIIVFNEEKSADNIDEDIMQTAKNIRRAIGLIMQCEVKLGISGPIYSSSEFAKGYIDAQFTLSNGSENISYYIDLKYEDTGSYYPYNLTVKVINAMFCENCYEISAEYQKLITEITHPKRNYETKGVLIKLLADVYKELSQRYADTFPQASNLLESCFFELSKNAEIEESIKHLGISLSELEKLILSKNNSKKIFIADRLKEYIDENYYEDITLDKIAKKFRVSSYYICRVFKNEKQINISSYITQIRINKAKELLTDPNNMIKSISIDVGFSDPNYFCKVFKKTTGLTPSEFRNTVTK